MLALLARGATALPGGDRQPPRVVHVLDRMEVGGMETVAVNLIERTASRYEHRVVCLRSAGPLAERLRAEGVQVVSIEKQPGKDFGAYLRLRRLLLQWRPALVHTYNIGAIDVALWARLAGVRRVVHAEHGRDAADPNGRNPRYRWLRRLLAPAISAFVPVSHDLADWLAREVRIPAARIVTITNGIDTEHYRPADAPSPTAEQAPSSQPRPITLVTVGRLDAVKAFDVLIDAFALLCERLPESDLRLIIAGGGPQRDALTQQIDRLAVGGLVRLAGSCDDVAALLRGTDVYVCSSIAEGVALTILEAMASALPVVATHVGGNPELVVADETGMLVPASDPVAMADALAQLVVDPARARALGRAGRTRACEQFSMDAMTNRYCHLYDNLLGMKTVHDIHRAES